METNILDKYSVVCIEMERIKNQIFELRDKTKKNILNAKTDNEKKTIYNDFKKKIHIIKKDQGDKYIKLKSERKKLKKIITEKLNNKPQSQLDSHNNDLIYLLKKYDNYK